MSLCRQESLPPRPASSSEWFADQDDYYHYRTVQDPSLSGQEEDQSCLKCQRSLNRQEILDAKIKRFLAHPITWKPSSDGSKLIGHMILNKNMIGDDLLPGSSNILGVKIVGGRITPSGTVGAIVDKVKRGSIAQTIGKLRQGDEVLEWNGRSLQGKTYEEVYDIISESKQEPQVELIVSRHLDQRIPMMGELPKASSFGDPMPSGHASITTSPLHHLRHSHHFQDHRFSARPRMSRRHTDIVSQAGDHNIHHSSHHQTLQHHHTYPDQDAPVLRQSSLGTHMPHRTRVRLSRSSTICGRVQVKLWYDISSLQLTVTVVSATELPPRGSGQPRNPYAKVILLPDRSEKSKRRTRTIGYTNDPKWNQTFVYSPLRITDLKSRALEVTLWDTDQYGYSDYLGESVIELSSAPLDDEAEWYLLGTHEETVAQLRQQQKLYLLPSDRLSPALSTVSRLSDSDVSEMDIIEYDSGLGLNTSRESWRTVPLADTSQSSFGSSNSPPLTTDDLRLRRATAGHNVDYYPHSLHELTPSGPMRGRVPRPRHQLLREAHMMASSLPSQYETGSNVNIRPIFRKALSQPSRSLSPVVSLHTPSEYHSGASLATMTPTGQLSRQTQVLWPASGSTGSAMSGYYGKKRQLPQVPPLSSRRSSRACRDQATLELEERARQWKLTHRAPSTETVNMQGMYSDSEVNTRTSYASEKLFYVHPIQRPASVAGQHRRGRGRCLARSMGPTYSPDRERLLASESSVPDPSSSFGQHRIMRPMQAESSPDMQSRARSGIRRGRSMADEWDSGSTASAISAFSEQPRQGRSLRHLVAQRSFDETGNRTSDTSSRPMTSKADSAPKQREQREHRRDSQSNQDITNTQKTMGQSSASIADDVKSEVTSEGAPESESGKTGSDAGTAGSVTGKKGKIGKLPKADSSSTSQLSLSGTKKRLGFQKKGSSSITIRRSEEVVPDQVKHLINPTNK
ncbi:Rab-3-interacting molecule unc-10 [Halotydeus destructor]|nr:Rab-3-interacting molecule unc-10 [Halotydeus destructor]